MDYVGFYYRCTINQIVGHVTELNVQSLPGGLGLGLKVLTPHPMFKWTC